MAQVALAWVLQKQPVTAPIVGVTKLAQLTDALGALEVELSTDDIKKLEAAYKPRLPGGFQ
jgi:aryl-alcohol dehydrogenase (NADP+)